jgi:hypothetical protein
MFVWQFLCWKEIQGTPLQEHVQWAALKSPLRTMEKVHRLYDGDVSRVLDICRQRIVFDTVANMFECLQAILTDNQVVVERIINCFSNKHNLQVYGSYR